MKPKKKPSAKKPCSVCRRWFTPDPRVRGSQRTCGDGGCQAEQRRRQQGRWRKRHPGYQAERRLREQVERAGATVEPGGGAPADRAPPEVRKKLPIHAPPALLRRVPFDFVQDAFGPEGVVLVAFLVRLFDGTLQTAMRPQPMVNAGISDLHHPAGPTSTRVEANGDATPTPRYHEEIRPTSLGGM